MRRPKASKHANWMVRLLDLSYGDLGIFLGGWGANREHCKLAGNKRHTGDAISNQPIEYANLMVRLPDLIWGPGDSPPPPPPGGGGANREIEHRQESRQTGGAPSNQPTVAAVFPQRNVASLKLVSLSLSLPGQHRPHPVRPVSPQCSAQQPKSSQSLNLLVRLNEEAQSFQVCQLDGENPGSVTVYECKEREYK